MTTTLHRTVAAAKAAVIGTVAVVAAGAAPTAAHAETAVPTVGTITVTNISQAEFHAAHSSLSCQTVGSVTMCQVVAGGYPSPVTWAVYADLGTADDSETGVEAVMDAESRPDPSHFHGGQTATVTSRWIKLTWGSPAVLDEMFIHFNTILKTGGTAYEYDCETSKDPRKKTYLSDCGISATAAQSPG